MGLRLIIADALKIKNKKMVSLKEMVML